jgi:type IV pilus assembly protein PilB
MGVADEVTIAKALASQLKIPLIRLDKMDIPKEIISLIPSELAESHLVVPIKETETGLLVAMADPLDLFAVDDLRFVTQKPTSASRTNGEWRRFSRKGNSLGMRYYVPRAINLS